MHEKETTTSREQFLSLLSQQVREIDNSVSATHVTQTSTCTHMYIYKTAKVLLETFVQNMPSLQCIVFGFKTPQTTTKQNKKKKIIKIRTNLVTKVDCKIAPNCPQIIKISKTA